jgi:MFS family permease
LRPILIVSLALLFQIMTVGMTFPTLNSFGASLGGTPLLAGLLWFFSAVPRALMTPFWGGLSDRMGRRPVFIIGALGTIAGSLLWARASSYEMLLASRFVDSVLSGQAALAFAVVADSLPRERHAAGMGMMGAVVSLGFIIGPLAGGILSTHMALADLGYVMGALQLVSLLLLLFALPETAKSRTTDAHWLTESPLHPASWRRLRALPAVPIILVSFFLLTTGYTHFNTAFQFSGEVWHGFDERKTSYGFALLGLLSAIVQGGLIRPLVPRFGERRIAFAGGILLAAGFVVMALGEVSLGVLYAGLVLAGVGIGLAMPTMSALISRATPDESQGLAQGFSQMAQSVGRGVGPVLGGAFFSYGPAVPFVTAAVLLALACFVLAASRPGRRRAAA